MTPQIQTKTISAQEQIRLEQAAQIAETKVQLQPHAPQYTSELAQKKDHKTKLIFIFFVALLSLASVIVVVSVSLIARYQPGIKTASFGSFGLVTSGNQPWNNFKFDQTEPFFEPVAIEFEEQDGEGFDIVEVLDMTECKFDDISGLQLQCLINEYRSAQGLNTLSNKSQLNQVAYDHSVWMSQRDTLSHIGRDASTFDQRCSDAGLECAQEMIARGPYTSAIKCLEGWVQSQRHNESILNPVYQEYGVGINNGYCTVLLN